VGFLFQAEDGIRDGHVTEFRRVLFRSRNGHKHVALFGREWAKVGPAQSQVEGQIPAKLEVVLSKEAPKSCAVVLANGRRETSSWIEPTPFVMRSIVEEVPQIEEVVVWHAATGTVLQVKQARELAAKLNRVASENLCGHIFIAVSPLIEDTAHIGSKRIQSNAPDLVN